MVITLFQAISSDQTCKFESRQWYVNSNDGKSTQSWTCVFYNETLGVAGQIQTNSKDNTKADSEVTAILYEKGNIVKFWPSSLFTKFPNIAIFKVSGDQGLEVIKPEYFKSAIHLKMIKIVDNKIVELQADLFVQAPRLENINLSSNRIAFIDNSTFSGLPNLKNIYLSKNRLGSLHYNIFQHLSNLLVLDLMENECIDQKFGNVKKNPKELESAVVKLCGQGTIEEIADKRKIKDLTTDNKNLSEELTKQRNRVQTLTDTNTEIIGSLKNCSHSNRANEGVNDKLDKMQKQINELAKNCGECKLDLIVSEKKSSDNYLSLLQTVQNDKRIVQEDSKEISRTCKKTVSNLEKIMQKAAKSIDDRLKKVEKKIDQENEIFDLDARMLN